MKLIRFAFALSLAVAVSGILQAQPAPKQKKRLLAIGETKGYEHDSTSYGLATIWKIGQESGAYDTYIRTDTELITKKKLGRNAKNLNYFDAILFFTTGELDMNKQQKRDLLSFIRDDGKGFIGVHCAADTFYKWPAYGKMLGGYFDGHPWHIFDAPIIVEDRQFPATRFLPKKFTIHDEIYQFKDYSRSNVRVLMRLDAKKINLSAKGVHRTDGDFPVAWARNYGKGRVFYSTLGHTRISWDTPRVQKMWLEAIKWCMGVTKGNATPRPKPAN